MSRSRDTAVMRMLVTGGAGFIGSHLCAAAVAAGHEVRVLDDLSTGLRANLDELPEVELLVGKIEDPERCAAAMRGVEVVLHLAARGSVPRSLEDPVATLRTNVEGTATVLDAARRAGVRRVVQTSSSSVYGLAPGHPRREAQPVDPRSPYAASKAAAEQLARAWHGSWGLETISLRLFNVYGPRQRPDSPYAAVIPRFIDAALRGVAAEIHGDGAQTRAFTYVDDVVAGLLAAASRPALGCGEIINLASHRTESIEGLHRRIARLTGVDIRPRRVPARVGDVPRSSADLGLTLELLGWAPRVELDEGLAATIAWHQQRNAA
jgi:nucleoside-diphosphate-sugar epimerase